MNIKKAILGILILIFITPSNGFTQMGAKTRDGKLLNPCGDGSSVLCDPFSDDGMSRICLSCQLYTSDSLMTLELSKVLTALKNQNRRVKKLIKNQDKWTTKMEKAAIKESNQYKGGTMEITEYYRKKIVLTKSRTEYVKALKI